MDDRSFDGLSRTLANTTPTRRDALRLLAGSGLATVLARFGGAETTAKEKRKKCKGKERKCGKRCCRQDQMCDGKRCKACTVCKKGCRFKTVQAAVDAAEPGSTIRVCDGTYFGRTDVDKNVVLVGAGAGRTRLHGNDVVIALVVLTGTTVRIKDLTVTGGRAPFDGGGIYNYGRLSLDHVAVTGNHADSSGGGIRNNGTLTLIRSRVTDNSAGGSGGGIINAGTLTSQQGSSVRGNRSGTQGGGIYNTITPTGSATVQPGSVRGNTPDQCAGTPVTGC